MAFPPGTVLGQLQKTLGLAFAIAIAVGGVVGAGILKVPGLVLDEVPLPGLVLVLWALGGIHALIGANVQAELVGSIPRTGGVYVPVRAAFGEFWGLVIGWSDWLSNVAAGASLGLACVSFLGLIVPGMEAYSGAISTALVLMALGLNWLGVRQGSVSQTIGSVLKLLFLGALIVAVLILVPPGTRAPAIVPAAMPGFFAIILAYQLVYGAFVGWSNPIYFVEEDRRATANIPKAMAIAIIVVALVYLAMNAGLMRALPLAAMRSSEFPAADALSHIPGVSRVLAALGFILAATCLNSTVMVLPRILYGLGRDGLFLPVATRVNPGGTPDIGLAVSGAFLVLLLLSDSYKAVFLLLGALTIFTFTLSDLALFVLRRRQPDLARPYRALGFPALPLLALLLDGSLLLAFIAADPTGSLYTFVLIAMCLPVHMLLRRRRLNSVAVH